MANEDTVFPVTLAAEHVDAARQRAAKAGFDRVEDWIRALVEVDLRRSELEAQVTNAIEQGDFQQLAADLRDKLRIAPKDPTGKR